MYTWKFGLSSNVMLAEPRCTETDLKSPTFVLFPANLTQFGCQIWHPCLIVTWCKAEAGGRTWSSVYTKQGCRICAQSGSDWHQIGKNLGIFGISFFLVHFGSPLKIIFKCPRFVPVGANLTHFGHKSEMRDTALMPNKRTQPASSNLT